MQLKFSIRDLLLVTLIVALAAAWWAHSRTMQSEFLRLHGENESLRDELRELRFPKMEPGEASEAMGTHTLEWIPERGS